MIKYLTITILMAQNAMGSHPDLSPNHPPVLDYASHQKKLNLCMVDLAEIKDPELRRWCVEQSKRLP